MHNVYIASEYSIFKSDYLTTTIASINMRETNYKQCKCKRYRFKIRQGSNYGWHHRTNLQIRHVSHYLYGDEIRLRGTIWNGIHMQFQFDTGIRLACNMLGNFHHNYQFSCFKWISCQRPFVTPEKNNMSM